MMDEYESLTEEEQKQLDELAHTYTEQMQAQVAQAERAISAYQTVRSYYAMCWYAAFVAGLWCGVVNRDMMQFAGSALGACFLLLTSQLWGRRMSQLIVPVIISPVAVWITGSLFGWGYARDAIYGFLGVLLFVLLAWMTSFIVYVIRHWRTPLA